MDKITFYEDIDVNLFLQSLDALIKELENPDSKYWKNLTWNGYEDYEKGKETKE